MDNLKVFKKMGRFVEAEINAINHSMQLSELHANDAMGLENRLLVDAWNTLTDRDCSSTTSAC